MKIKLFFFKYLCFLNSNFIFDCILAKMQLSFKFLIPKQTFFFQNKKKSFLAKNLNNKKEKKKKNGEYFNFLFLLCGKHVGFISIFFFNLKNLLNKFIYEKICFFSKDRPF